MSKQLRWMIVILLIVIILLWFLLFKPPIETRPPVLLMDANGMETVEFQLLDSILLDAVNLSPRTGYDIRIVREDGLPVSEVRLSTDHVGRIPETPIWYNIGLLPCHKIKATRTADPVLPLTEIHDASYAGKKYELSILQDGNAIRKLDFHIAATLTRPTLYITDKRSCPKSGFLIGEEDIWVEGKNFPENSIIRLWAVPARSGWNDDDPLQDQTKQYIGDMPPLFELKVSQRSFKKLLWPKGLTSVGSYDVVAEVVTYSFGSFRTNPSATAQNVVAHRGYTGFVVQRRQNAAQPLEMDIAGAVQSPFAFRSAFLTNEDVYVGVDPAVQPSFVGKTADVYIVIDKTEAQWVADPSLSDMTGVIEKITVNGICGNCWKTLAWSQPLTEGKYDVVLDFNSDGQYTPGVDLIDSLDATGFTVAKMRIDSITFNYSGSGAITLYDDINSTNVAPPEYLSAAQTVKPAAWVMGGSHSIQANFKSIPSVNSAQIWATGSLGGLNNSTSPVSVSFSGGFGQAVFSVNNPPNVVDKSLVSWNWQYKNINGTNTASFDMGQTGQHIIYSVLATPNAPQAQPWVRALEIAAGLAQGSTTATDATRNIWNDFYQNTGGLYDTYGGAPQYTGGTTAAFNLKQWLSNYNSGNIGVVNCYDMGKSVVVFANALGAGAEYTYVGPFGYLNCVHPIGRGWANNPFYDNPGYNSNPVVNGDWSYSDGRSGFGNHGFTRLAGQIYDGSGGQVDIDGDPDACAGTIAHDLDGDDSWTNQYQAKVIDDVPASSPGTPTDYTFSVY
jgi:hypothetical protein